MTTATARAAAPDDNSRPLITEAELRDQFGYVDESLKKIEVDAEKVPTIFEDDDDLEAAKAMAPRLRGAVKRINELREQTKAPYLAAGNLVQSHFKALEKRVVDIAAKQEASATRYLRKKEDAAREAQRKIESEQRAEAARLAEVAKAKAQEGKLDEAVTTQVEAQRAEVRAADAAQLVDARPADLARTSTASGTSTLVAEYEFKIVDKAHVDIWTLHGYFLESEIKAAITRYVKAGGRELRGVEIFPAPKARL